MISVCEEETDNCVCSDEYCKDTMDCNDYMYAKDRHSECCAITYQERLRCPREAYDKDSSDDYSDDEDSSVSDYESFKAVSGQLFV